MRVSGAGPAALTRDLRVAQLMVERGLSPEPAALAGPGTKPKGFLRWGSLPEVPGA